MHTCDYKIALASVASRIADAEGDLEKARAAVPWFRPFLRAKLKGAEIFVAELADQLFELLRALSANDRGPCGGANA